MPNSQWIPKEFGPSSLEKIQFLGFLWKWMSRLVIARAFSCRSCWICKHTNLYIPVLLHSGVFCLCLISDTVQRRVCISYAVKSIWKAHKAAICPLSFQKLSSMQDNKNEKGDKISVYLWSASTIKRQYLISMVCMNSSIVCIPPYQDVCFNWSGISMSSWEIHPL